MFLHPLPLEVEEPMFLHPLPVQLEELMKVEDPIKAPLKMVTLPLPRIFCDCRTVDLPDCGCTSVKRILRDNPR